MEEKGLKGGSKNRGEKNEREEQCARLRGEHVLAIPALPWIRREKDGKRDG